MSKNNGIGLQTKQEIGNSPDFSLPNAMAELIKLSKKMKGEPVILIWYRGGWCPYCNLTLHYLQQNLTAFKEQGAHLPQLISMVKMAL